MSVNSKKKLKKQLNRSFLAKDFESLRQDLVQNARIFFPNQIQDFSEPSVAGMLVDLMASVGDSLSFYLDHQFRELDPMLAVEPVNIITHLRNAGVKIFGAAASLVDLTFTMTVPSKLQNGTSYVPDRKNLPVILRNTICVSDSGVQFSTLEDVDVAAVDSDGNLLAKYRVKSTNSDGAPATYDISVTVSATSGLEKTQRFTIPNTHVAFRELTLADADVTMIRSVIDLEGDEYHEVESLSQDTVFIPVDNTDPDSFSVKSNLEIVAAPKRYVPITDPQTRRTVLRFGSGDADSLDDDILPDPSDLSLELVGKNVIKRFSIDPKSLLETQTLGISPKNTTLSVTYRYGGGASHNVSANSIKNVSGLLIDFRRSPDPLAAVAVRSSITVINSGKAAGAANAPDLETLRTQIVSARLSQGRMVTREDVLARIYTMPSTFGRVFRAAIAENPVNPQATTLYALTRDRAGKLDIAPDTLKKNLSKYLNEFRLISDAYDILDAQIINFGVKYEAVVAKNANKQQVGLNINNKIADLLQTKYFQIDQPLIIDDITSTILAQDFVIALSALRVFPITSTKEGRVYSQSSFPFERSTKKGMIFGPPGAMFELKFPEFDIIGNVL
jgi:hypothetical protein